VDAVPVVDDPADWGEARDEADAAEKALEAAEAKAAASAGAVAGAQTLADHAAEVAADARAAAEAAGPRSALDAALLAHGAADAALRQAREADTAARSKARAARQHLADASGAEARARSEFDAARDVVADLHPPPATRVDLGADWAALVAWAEAQVPVHEAAAVEAEGLAAALQAEVDELHASLVAQLDAVGIAVGRQSPAEAVAGAIAAARVRHEDLTARVAEAEAVRERAEHAAERATVASTLATHLKADRFEKWLLDEAFSELLEGASGLLHELSGGAYSLELDARREFSVVDHRNADERRSVKTLSGGETFLASLALALSLADKVVALAPGQVRLESLFLDEGFGTLDPASLETVTTAIEHLGSADRLVGIVTHVPELAARLPVRFAVNRGPKGATVEKILQ
jgi:exonuclease SbcC